MPLTQPSKLELNTIRELIEFDDLRVLEIGAGDGRLTFPLAGQAARWVALDPDADEVRLAADELRAQPLPAVRLALGEAQKLSFESESFDIVFFTWSLC
ncbi:MAG: class I SAM-dependent methyltransferase [Anaerolineales bacterium]|nr:class I SAM-dependent methyltransferase [Anaerolineales bacterium]